MERGVLSDLGSASNITTQLASTLLSGKQQWTNLDTNGNWLDYREKLGTPTRRRRAIANETNEYTCLGPFGSAVTTTQCNADPSTSPLYDAAGNMRFSPLGRNVGTPGISGQEYAYDEENRVIAIYKDTNQSAGPDADSDGRPDEPLMLAFAYDALGRSVETH